MNLSMSHNTGCQTPPGPPESFFLLSKITDFNVMSWSSVTRQ